jgi:Tfp pilus assembly protein PilN
MADIADFVGPHRRALVGISRNLTFLKLVRLPRATPEDLRRLLSVQMSTYFPLPASQLSFAFHQTSDHTPEGLLTLVAAVRADDLKRLRSELQQVGLVADRVLPTALAAPVVAAHSGLKDALIIDSAPTGYALDVVRNGILRFSRTIPRGGDPESEAGRTLAAAGDETLPILVTDGLILQDSIAAHCCALEALHEAPPMDLVLAEDVEREARARTNNKTRLAALLFAAALLLGGYVWVDRSDQLAVVQQAEAKSQRVLASQRTFRDAESRKADRLSGIQTVLQRAFRPAQPLSDQIDITADSAPAGSWLTGISVQRGQSIEIRGTAAAPDAISQYVNAVGGSPRFRDVKLVFANSAKIDQRTVVEFNITATAVGNLPLPEPEKRAGHSSTAAPTESSAGGESGGTEGAQ